MERLSVMASTADIQVKANRGRTTQELHRDALREGRQVCVEEIKASALVKVWRERQHLHQGLFTPQ